MKSPFKFLDAYTKEDRDIFFGREKEIEELYHRVFDSRILLVYGESGTGKSSIIQCGLANKFRDSDWLPILIRRGDNLPDSIARAVKAAATTPIDYELLTTAMFKKAIRSLYIDYYKPIYFIFDQFEELFIFGSKEEKQSLVHLVQALVDSDIECRFIFIMREEYIANVTEFEKNVHGFLSNRVRIERMPHENAVQTINGPCKVYDIDMEQGFPEKLLNKLSPDSPDIELTYLQVFLDKIYNLALKKKEEEKSTLRFSSDLLEKTGDVSDLLGSFLEEQISLMPDKDAALAVLKSFVSVKGTKRQLTSLEVKDNSFTLGKSIEEPLLLEMIQAFVHLRILRDKDQNGRYELRHDALASKIFEKISNIEKEILEIRQFVENAYYNWQRRDVLLTEDDLKYIGPYRSRLYLSEELSLFIEKSEKALEGKRRRRRQLAIIIPSVVILVLSCFTIWALLERRKSDINYIKAKANNYGMMAREIALTDPTKALRLAEYALSLDSSEDVRKIMYQIYRENSFYKIIAKLPGRVNAISLSPDGKHLLIGCGDGIARLMDLQGKIVQEYTGHTGSINSVAFSTRGDSILTGSWDFTARLWSIRGDLIHIFQGHKNIVNSVAFSPDGNKIITGSLDGTAKLWDINGKMLQEIYGMFDCRSVAFSPDGNSILMNADSISPGLLTLQGKRIKTYTGHSHAIQKVIFSPDGKYILSSSTDGTAILHDLNGNIITTFKGHNHRVVGIAFSKDGKTVLTTSLDNTVRVWNLHGELIQVLKGHEGDVLAATFSEDRKTIFSVAADNTVRSWELQNNVQHLFTIPKELCVRGSQFSSESKTVLILRNYYNATLYDLNGNLIHDYRDPEGRIGIVRLSADGQTILTGAYNNTGRLLRLWNSQGKELAVFRNMTGGGIISDSVIYTFSNQLISFYDLKGNFINQIKCPAQNIYSSPDKRTLLYSDNQGSAWLTDLQNKPLMVFRGHESPINSMIFSPDGKMILTGSNDFTAILWDISGSPLHVFKEHTGTVQNVAFSPDGQKILTRDADAIVRLWDLKGNLIQIFNGMESPLVNAFFADDGNTILTVSLFGAVHLSDIKDPLTDFQKRDYYEKLSVSQEIEMGITSYNDVIKLNDADRLFEAANLYYSNSAISKTDKKDEYLNNAYELNNKLVELFPEKLDYLFNLLKMYTDSYVLNPTEKIAIKVESINKKVLDLKSFDNILSAANFYNSIFSPSDSTAYKLNIPECLFGLIERIITLSEADVNLIKGHLSNFRDLSYSLILKKEFMTGLKGLKVCYMADSTDNSPMNIGDISMAYLVNGQFENAKRIINKWKNVPVTGFTGIQTFGEGFLALIDELESYGITHPDFAKAKDLLNK
jgi:WD40 repeat protein